MGSKREINEIVKLLREIFKDDKLCVKEEYGKKKNDKYYPRLDFAISYAGKSIAVRRHKNLIRKLIKQHNKNVKEHNHEDLKTSYDDIKGFNEQAEHFMAIECDKTGDKKRLMGGIINASTLGRIGLSIAMKDKKLVSLIKILAHLKTLRKNKFSFPRNHLLLSKEQFCNILSGFRFES